nr:hypothetical protein [Cressdnaviricota sp.]UOF79758.1 hypothetical protein [Cressdnaviricota sp.]
MDWTESIRWTPFLVQSYKTIAIWRFWALRAPPAAFGLGSSGQAGGGPPGPPITMKNRKT